MSYILSLRVDGDMIRVDAEIIFHPLINLFFRNALRHTFFDDDVVGDAGTETVLHHIASGVNHLHAVDRDVPIFCKMTRKHVVVRSWTVVDVIDDGSFLALKDIPRPKVANPIRVGLGNQKLTVVDIDTFRLIVVLRNLSV